MNATPLVTVLIPTYNHEFFVAQAIDSVLNQDYPNLQIIVADDASQDKTPAIVKSYVERFPDKIQALYFDTNKGVSRNVTEIYPLIRGEYTCWFSGDDVMLPGKISKQLAFMQANPDVILSYHDVMVCANDASNTLHPLYRYNDPVAGQKAYTNHVYEHLITNRCFISGMSTMVHHKNVEDLRHRHDIPYCSDWLYFTELAKRGRIGYIDEVLGLYRRHANNATNKILIEYEVKVYNALLASYPDSALIVEKGLVALYCNTAFKALRLGQWDIAKACFRDFAAMVKMRPPLFLHASGQFLTTVFKRLYLALRTGDIVR